MIAAMLQERKLPPILREGEQVGDWPAHRKELMDFFTREVYGEAPAVLPISVEIEKAFDGAFGGKAAYKNFLVTLQGEKGSYSWPVHFFWPLRQQPMAILLNISFNGRKPRFPLPFHLMGMPVEEIIDRGYAFAEYCYLEVSSDDNNFSDGLAGFFDGENRKPGDWGKIALWSYAASRTREALRTLEETENTPIYIMGCSRLGKTALWAGVADSEFAGAFAIDSGCGGVAINRGKVGELPDHMIDEFPFWYCGNYHKYRDIPIEEHPFDHHMLVACMAPRPFYSASATNDQWADPVSEFLSLEAASPVFALLGEKGFVHPDTLPEPQHSYNEGNPGMFYRLGNHGSCREDYNGFMDFLDTRL